MVQSLNFKKQLDSEKNKLIYDSTKKKNTI